MEVQPYQAFSKVFDRITKEEKYARWERFVRSVWSRHDFSPGSLVDVACGTGNNALRYASHGLKVYGVDRSREMLDMARSKDPTVRYIRGDMTSFLLPERVDAALCLDFSTNYIMSSDEFLTFVNRVYDMMHTEGIFIYDFKPAAKFKAKERHVVGDGFIFDWKCDASDPPHVTIDVTVEMDGEKFCERHVERGYSVAEMRSIVKDSDFELLGMHHDCTLSEATDDSDLIQVVLRR